MILVVPVYAKIHTHAGDARMDGQVIIDVGAEDLVLGDGVIGMPGFKYALPLEELPVHIMNEVYDAGIEWASGNVGVSPKSVDVEFYVGKQSTSQVTNVRNDSGVEEDLHDCLMEWMMDLLDVSYGSPMALDHGARGVITL